MTSVIEWKEKHPDMYEFILFNIMSNVATITNFTMLWIGNGWLFQPYAEQHFTWFLCVNPCEKNSPKFAKMWEIC